MCTWEQGSQVSSSHCTTSSWLAPKRQVHVWQGMTAEKVVPTYRGHGVASRALDAGCALLRVPKAGQAIAVWGPALKGFQQPVQPVSQPGPTACAWTGCADPSGHLDLGLPRPSRPAWLNPYPVELAIILAQLGLCKARGPSVAVRPAKSLHTWSLPGPPHPTQPSPLTAVEGGAAVAFLLDQLLVWGTSGQGLAASGHVADCRDMGPVRVLPAGLGSAPSSPRSGRASFQCIFP